MRKLYFFVVTLLISFVGKSQQTINSYFPDYYSSYFLLYEPLTNPAFTNHDRKELASLNTLYKSRTGLLNEVASFTAYADLSINPKQKFTQVLRVLFQNEQEGPYISSPKFFGNYAIRVPLRKNLSLSLGLALGMSSMNFTAPSGMGIARVLDGNAGGILKYKKTNVGLASYQIFNNSNTALNGTIFFKRYYQFQIQSELKLNQSLSAKGSLFWRPMPLLDLANGALSLCYKEIITVGLLYQLRRGSSFLTSFQINQNKNPLLLNFTYNSPFLNSLLVSTPSFEIGIQYRINHRITYEPIEEN